MKRYLLLSIITLSFASYRAAAQSVIYYCYQTGAIGYAYNNPNDGHDPYETQGKDFPSLEKPRKSNVSSKAVNNAPSFLRPANLVGVVLLKAATRIMPPSSSQLATSPPKNSPSPSSIASTFLWTASNTMMSSSSPGKLNNGYMLLLALTTVQSITILQTISLLNIIQAASS